MVRCLPDKLNILNSQGKKPFALQRTLVLNSIRLFQCPLFIQSTKESLLEVLETYSF